MPRNLALALALASILAASGCAFVDPTPPLRAARGDTFVATDLPVPEGFVLDGTQSLKHERSEFRRLHLIYRRSEYLSEARVREFLKETLPKAGWELVFVHGLEDTKLLCFKGAEECRIRVFQHGTDRYTQLEIDVEPRRTPEGAFVARSVRPAATERSVAQTTPGKPK